MKRNELLKKQRVDSFSFLGKWGTDVDENKFFHGELEFFKGRIILKIFGDDVDNMYNIFSSKKVETPNIYGMTEYGEYISVFGCMKVASNYNFPRGYNSHKYICSSFFVSKTIYLSSEEEKYFTSCSFSLLNYSNWENPVILQSYKVNEKNKPIETRITINYNNYKYNKIQWLDKKISLQKGFISRLKSQDNESMRYSENKLITVEKYFIINTKNKKKESIKYFHDLCCSFSNLFSIVLGQYADIMLIDLYLKGKVENYITQIRDGRYFFASIDLTEKTQDVEKTQIFSADEFNIYSECILKNWFIKKDELYSIVKNYVSCQLEQSDLVKQFLMMVQNFEVYYRTFLGSESADEDSFAVIEQRSKVLNYIENELTGDKEKIRKYVENFKDDTSLRKRINEIFRELPMEIIWKIVPGYNKKNMKSFVNSIVDTRNYYTHGDDENKYKKLIKNMNELYVVVENLKRVTEFLIFFQLGVDENFIGKRISEKVLCTN